VIADLPPPGGFLEPLLAAARDRPDRVFARFGGVALTFGDLDRRTAALAAGLAARGLRPGDRVAGMLRNSADAVVTILALARTGLVWVPVNAQAKGPGLRHILDHSDPALVIAEPDLAPGIAASGAAPRPLLPRGPALSALIDGAEAEAPPLPAPETLCALMYTSGTTGPAKGVRVTHRMMRVAAEGVARVTDARPGDVMFLWEPLYHIGGAQMLGLPGLVDVELAIAPGFSARRFWPQVAASGATHLHYLGGILQILLKQPPCPEERENRVRAFWGGGCPAEVFEAARDRWGHAIRECYGMTEMSSITTVSDGGAGGVVGEALPWFRVMIRDAEGRPLPPGTRGEIVVETADPGAFFDGYHRNPEATARTLREGRLHTGDMGSMDAEGTLRFHGRQADALRIRGENVSAWEIEHVVTSHPDVEDCAVTGTAAEVGEQEAILHVQPRNGATLDPAALSAWLAPRLARYQLPRYIRVVEGFARTPSQRIMKHALPQDPEGAWDRLAQEETR
jgi:crotonobetaine/carnitine-CoA ligase